MRIMSRMGARQEGHCSSLPPPPAPINMDAHSKQKALWPQGYTANSGGSLMHTTQEEAAAAAGTAAACFFARPAFSATEEEGGGVTTTLPSMSLTLWGLRGEVMRWGGEARGARDCCCCCCC